MPPQHDDHGRRDANGLRTADQLDELTLGELLEYALADVELALAKHGYTLDLNAGHTLQASGQCHIGLDGAVLAITFGRRPAHKFPADTSPQPWMQTLDALGQADIAAAAHSRYGDMIPPALQSAVWDFEGWSATSVHGWLSKEVARVTGGTREDPELPEPQDREEGDEERWIARMQAIAQTLRRLNI